MTVLIYVVTSKQVGDADHLKVFANAVPVGNSILLATDIESGDAPPLCERFVA
jgi:hypothetical protein